MDVQENKYLYLLRTADVFVGIKKEESGKCAIEFGSTLSSKQEPDCLYSGITNLEEANDLADKFFEVYRNNYMFQSIPVREELAVLKSKDTVYQVMICRELEQKNEKLLLVYDSPYRYAREEFISEKTFGKVLKVFMTKHDGKEHKVYESMTERSFSDYREAFKQAETLIATYEEEKRLKRTNASVLGLRVAAGKYINLIETSYMLKQYLKQAMDRSIKINQLAGMTKAEEVWLLSHEKFVKSIMQHKAKDNAEASDVHTFYIASTVFNEFIEDSNRLFDELRSNAKDFSSSREQSLWYNSYLPFVMDVEVRNKGLLNEFGWDIK
ncbi:hypothetical protein AAXE64_28065 [Priestia megaterium]